MTSRPSFTAVRRALSVCDARPEGSRQFGLVLRALCMPFGANTIEGRVQHVGELAATLGDQLAERLLFALERLDSLQALPGKAIGLSARVIDHALTFRVEVRTRLLELVTKTSVLELVRLPALVELLLGGCCRTPGLFQEPFCRLLGCRGDLIRSRVCVRDKLFARTLRGEQNIADRRGIR